MAFELSLILIQKSNQMLKSYFTTGLRNLFSQKVYSLIKVVGLSLGLAASIMIYLYIQEDLSYDKAHQHYQRIVRILTIDSAEGVSSKLVGVTQPRLAPAALLLVVRRPEYSRP